MKKLLFFFVFNLIIAQSYNSFSQSLKVQDPRSTWNYDYGSLDSATLTVRPAGAYVEYSLFLSISAKSTIFTRLTDTVEIQYFFNLNKNAMVIDSWLWVEDTIVKAILIDRNEAQQIYEGIVQRRRDPSILYKNNSTSYEMRIFPLAGTKSRRVKISWLQPVDINNKTATVQLPLDMIRISKAYLPYLRVLFYDESGWTNPRLSNSGIVVNPIVDPVFGKCKEAIITDYKSANTSIVYDSPLSNSYYMKFDEDYNGQGYYQIVINPKKLLDFSTTKKVLLLVDYDGSKTNVTRESVLKYVKNILLNNFTSKDSFNLGLSSINPYFISDNWIQATPENISLYTDSNSEQKLAPYSNLPALLVNGYSFINEHSKQGTILLLSCSDSWGHFKTANAIIEQIQSIRKSNYQFNVVDFSESRTTYQQNSKYYAGNFYLYDYLTKSSGGYYIDYLLNRQNLDILGGQIINNMEGTIQNLEMYSTLESGFCFGRYNLNLSQSGDVITQLGRYVGKFPMKLRITGFFRDIGFTKEISIDTPLQSDSLLLTRRMWYGNYINNLENSPKTNEIVNEIITVSEWNRVLSLYTAFLALEPWRMPQGNDIIGNKDDNVATEISEKIVQNNLEITMFPNPFSNQITIKLDKLIENINLYSIEIYNTLGQKVSTLDINQLNNDKLLIWNGMDDMGNLLPNGKYLLVIKSNTGTSTFNLIIMR